MEVDGAQVRVFSASLSPALPRPSPARPGGRRDGARSRISLRQARRSKPPPPPPLRRRRRSSTPPPATPAPAIPRRCRHSSTPLPPAYTSLQIIPAVEEVGRLDGMPARDAALLAWPSVQVLCDAYMERAQCVPDCESFGLSGVCLGKGGFGTVFAGESGSQLPRPDVAAQSTSAPTCPSNPPSPPFALLPSQATMPRRVARWRLRSPRPPRA